MIVLLFERYIKEFLEKYDEIGLDKKIGNFFNDMFGGHKININDRIDLKQVNLAPLDPASNSPHISLCISGFLSEQDKLDKNWESLSVKLYEFFDFYYYNWQATTKTDMVFDAFAFGAKTLIGVSENKKKDGKTDLQVMEEKFIEYCNNDNLFIKAKEYSKVFGRLLAYILVSRCIFHYQTFSLIGFSLGCNVIKNCLKELHKLADIYPAANDIIQNVVFIAGATNFNKKDIWEKRFDAVVGGRIINCHGTYDDTLKLLFKIATKRVAIGSEAQSLSKIENFDFSYLKLGHKEYKAHMDEILAKINLV